MRFASLRRTRSPRHSLATSAPRTQTIFNIRYYNLFTSRRTVGLVILTTCPTVSHTMLIEDTAAQITMDGPEGARPYFYSCDDCYYSCYHTVAALPFFLIRHTHTHGRANNPQREPLFSRQHTHTHTRAPPPPP